MLFLGSFISYKLGDNTIDKLYNFFKLTKVNK